GFEKGDLVIKLLADILRDLIPGGQFIGHVGGDDFVVILDGHRSKEYCKEIIERFESEVLTLYHETDIQNGYVTTISRRGIVERFPLITLTAVMLNNKSYHYKNSFEVSSLLADLKTKEKRLKVG
ncbi:MAG: diguanylate cyclase domain-containing protein, partial [Christensenellales bacterium]